MKTMFRVIPSKLSLTLLIAMGTVSATFAQGDIPSGTIVGSGSGPFNYSLTFSDGASATSPIGSVWYGWIPGFFYLPSSPTSASAPVGWSATVSGNSVQYVASSSLYDIQPGQALSGFGYQATFSPAQLAAAPNSGDSYAYTAGLFSDVGAGFTVQAVPEPSSMGLLGAGGLGLMLAGCRYLRTSKVVSKG
ncbi:MAG TPA: PEP-CTERM sorting domain-containing protein [Verrucomicrobiae bacterium]|nr:PEP-CTERM sorting domain-containing protein [Verrucomicrobiae bacterium]